ncbi:serine hydrolase domain-containing protein [Sphingomonas sp.]|jgi:CubicO group peptidase (beta-lactamase class C family)|uniref:serine hydrolase domain-containing protein n=1 Tax=Sphingomonas sp. TaxID=28214 RepID=UPI002DECEB97|nr:serine hydrolase domain-containing protein [Sphingomonas sp.]
MKSWLALALLSAPAQAATIEEMIPTLDRIMGDYQQTAPQPGMVYGIVKDGRLVHVRGFGVQDPATRTPVSADSLFRIASMSKAFTAMAILKLRDEGKLRLDDPAERYVPEMKAWRYPTTDSPRITVRDLITHTAGFVEDNPWGDRQQPMPEAEFTSVLRQGVPWSRGPGLAMEYSNFGYATLGRIVRNVSGKSYQAFITRSLFHPLGMASTTFDIFKSPAERRTIGYRWQDGAWVREPDMADGSFGAMGGVETSANDYAKWVAFILSAWPARDGADNGPVKRATVREIVEGANMPQGVMRNASFGGAPCRQAVTYGMGWRVIDDCDLGRVVTHSGGYPGYGSIVYLLPDKGVGIFAFSNRTYSAPSAGAWRALMALNAAEALPGRPAPVSAGLAQAYQQARSIWQRGDVTGAPLANNFLLDRDADRWKAEIARVKREVGTCVASEEIEPISAMEGFFTWICETGRIRGRVQRAPTPQVTIQALSYAVAAP